MSYKSPIEIATDLSNAFMLKVENEVVKAVYNVGVKVDKDELLRALVYDREQYKAGYLDGIENRIPIEWLKTHGSNLVIKPDRKYTSENMAFLYTLIAEWREMNEQRKDS